VDEVGEVGEAEMQRTHWLQPPPPPPPSVPPPLLPPPPPPRPAQVTAPAHAQAHAAHLAVLKATALAARDAQHLKAALIAKQAALVATSARGARS